MSATPILSRRAVAAGLAGVATLAHAPVWATARPPAAPFAAGLQSLGWWMRRPTGCTIPGMMPYYQQVIGLPLIRAWQNDLVLLWAGEDQVFEVKTDDNPARVQSDPASAALIPVFRVHDLARWQARMTSFGHAPITRRQSRWGRTLLYRGPDRLTVGFEQRDPRSPLSSDRKALARWRAGPLFRLGGLPALPDTLHHLSRAIRHVADVPAMMRFYRDKVGFTYLGREGTSALFALGEETVLELAPGGIAVPEPVDRAELSDSFVLRIHDLDMQIAGLRMRGAGLKGPIIIKEETTRLQFVPDPEGWIMGIEERGRIRDRYIDDVEAERRWRMRTG